MYTDNNAEQYPIGAVVKLTGLTSHNIRVWEKRHQAVVAGRLPSGRRYYTQVQVNRLLLLKYCISCGFSISELAELDDSQLQEKIDQNAPRNKQIITQGEAITVGILSQSDLIEPIQRVPGIDIVLHETLIDFSKIHLHNGLLSQRPNVVILEIPSISEKNISSITELLKHTNPLLAIIIYRFSNRAHLSALRNQGVRVLRSPIDQDTLYYLLSGFLSNNGWMEEESLPTPLPNQYPAHIYSYQQLTKIAKLPNTIECECPHHLVDLLNGLKEFETYSGDCINKNDADAALHAEIQLTTATARHQLEMLLKKVLRIEGIEI